MKKLLSLLLVCVLAVSLTACNRNKYPDPPEAPEATGTPTPQEILAASASDTAQARQPHVPPASSSDTVVDTDGYGKALGYVGQPASSLIAAIGRRRAPRTASSTTTASPSGPCAPPRARSSGTCIWTSERHEKAQGAL